MTIYIDTNIIISESFLKSPQVQALFKACKLLNINVVIPQIVIDETKNNYPKKLADKLDVYKKAETALRNIIDIAENDVSVLEQAEIFNEWFDEQIDNYEIEIIGYPEIGLQALVQASYLQKKPFKAEGEGYKDFIVWSSIVNHINSAEGATENFFLNNNVTDFCEKNENGEHVLHSELCAQVAEGKSCPVIYKSVKALFDALLSPRLEGIELAEIPQLTSSEIEEYARERIVEDLSGSNIYGLNGVPFGNEISIRYVENIDFSDIELKKVDDEIIISVIGKMDVEVDGFIEKHQYYEIAEREAYDIYVHDGDWNDWMMWVGINVETPVEVSLFYSLSNGAIIGHKVSLPDEIEDEYPYK